MIKTRNGRVCSYTVILVFIMGLVAFGLSSGHVKLPYEVVLNALFGQATKRVAFTIFTLRMPRLLITLIMGMALALSGSVLQTVTNNDLADPGIIGINAGAGLGVTIAYLLFNFDIANVVFMIPLFGFLGALSTFSLTLYFARDGYGIDVDKLILLGIGTAIALSGIMIVLISSAERGEVQFIQSWLSGDIWGDKMSFVYIVAPLILVGTLLVFYRANTLNILNLDDISVQSLGVAIRKERVILIILAVALASIVVSVGGSISFVGLIVPHIAKKLYGPDHRYALLGALLLGGLFLLGADILGRHIFLPEGILPGIVVSIIGAPYFLFLLLKSPKTY